MDSMISQQVEHEEPRAQASRAELVERIGRALHEDGTVEPLRGLHLQRSSSPNEPLFGVSKPAFCMIAQGSKEIFLNAERYLYDPFHYLLITAELPLLGYVRDASNESPYLSLLLELDPALVSSVMIEAGDVTPENHAEVRAIHVNSLDSELLDAGVRLVRLLEASNEAPFIAPLITREIIYRLWMGQQRDRLRYIAALGGSAPHIAKAIERFQKDFDQPLRIENIASELGMSVSGFHQHFKAVTAMSPLQFQKRLRLQEARRLMLGEGLDATSAAFRVGYRASSHFNREYKSLFGLPPRRDMERLRGTTKENISFAAD